MLTVWRANVLGSSGKGHEYFLRHLLGTTETRGPRRGVAAGAAPARRASGAIRPRRASSTCSTTIDFRMTSNALFSDVVLPAATWYEKYDLSSTDMHPFVHAFNAGDPAAVGGEDRLGRLQADRRGASPALAATHLGVRRDLVAAPLLHDTPDELAQPLGEVRDWRAGECEPVPGKTMPKLLVVERDYPARRRPALAALGPLLEELGIADKGAGWKPIEEVARAARRATGPSAAASADGRPSLERVEHACEAILAALGHDQRPAGRRGLPLARARARASPLADLAGRAGRRPDHLRRRAGAAAHGDHLAGVVGDRGARPPLRAVHDQRRAREALAHAVGPPALLPRPCLDARARRGPARLPPAAAYRAIFGDQGAGDGPARS